MPKPKANQAKPTSCAPSRSPLSRTEWDFSGVPDNELVPCLLFEYLRESATAQRLSNALLPLAHPTKGWHDDARVLLEQVEQMRISINHPLNTPHFINMAIIPIVAWNIHEQLKSPWQQLSPKPKLYLTQSCTEVDAAAYFADSDVYTDQLANAMREAVIEDIHADKDAPAILKAMADVNLKGSYPGRKVFGIVADFARYDDNGIRAAMALRTEEIIRSRPAGIKPQFRRESGRGRNAEWRGVLNSLGMARLSVRYKAHVLRAKLPDAYAQITDSLADKGTTAAQKKLDGARNRFLNRFHKILPFEKLPPLCLNQSPTEK